MMKFYDFMDLVLRKGQEGIVIATGAIACLLIIINALLRYILKLDMYGSDEVIMLCAFWLYFMGSSLATREDSHLSADFITTLIRTPRQRAILKLVQHIVSLVISVMATYWAYKYVAWSFGKAPKTPILKFPVIWMQFPIFLSFVLSDFYILCSIVMGFRRFPDTSEEKA